MVEAKRALVAPRVRVEKGAETEPIEDAVARLLDGGDTGLLQILGGPGSGKATAIAHLAAVLPPSDRLEYRPRCPRPAMGPPPPGRLVIFSGAVPYAAPPLWPPLRLAPWGRDEIVEFLLARGADRIAGIVGTLPKGTDPFDGVPEIWAAVLDRMIAEPAAANPKDALRRVVADLDPGSTDHRLLRHEAVRILLEADAAFGRLEAGRVPDRLPVEIVPDLAARIGPGSAATACLAEVVEGRVSDLLRAAAEILHATDPEIVGRILTRRAECPNTIALLQDARLVAARWENARLRWLDLSGADLTGAILGAVEMEDVDLRRAVLAGATFAGARLVNCSFLGADLSGTDFAGATLTACRFEGGRLDSRCFAGAAFRSCKLPGADLEGFDAPGADFRGSDFAGANLTSSCLEGGNLLRVRLNLARLADIRWRGADLRHANFDGATFHLGSTRGGLVDSPIASEGTRTGFYTDEREELTYRDPDEVRKADLRGASTLSLDLYLVDLRGARLDPPQLEHARRCGAIL